MATTSYKCLGCGAGIHYKPELGKFKCDYCLNEYTEAELSTDSKPKYAEKLNSYHCKSCGAQVVTDETTTSTFCYYCHNPVIISHRLAGEFEPNKIIPFSIDKEKAKEYFLKWAGKKRLVPDDFTSTSQLEKITGVYLPYWWVDYKANIDYVGEGRNIRVWRVGDREYTETKKYQIVRNGEVDLNNVSEVAFTKIDKNLLNGIGPYHEKDAIPFSMPYLSGFFAEQYDLDKEKISPILKEQVDRYYNYILNENISGYNHVRTIRSKIDIKDKEWTYTLLPAWILTYIYNGRTYVFAVNGQTGKSYGELPISNRKLSIGFSAIFGITTLILLLGGWLIW